MLSECFGRREMPHLREGDVDRRRVADEERGLAGGDGRPRDALESIVGEREERAVPVAGLWGVGCGVWGVTQSRSEPYARRVVRRQST